MLLRVLFRCFNRLLVEVKTMHLCFGKGLRHDHRGDAMTTAHVGDRATLSEFSNHTVERRQPGLNQMIVVAGTEEAGDRTGKALGLVTPADAFARAERNFHLRHVMLESRRRAECRCEVKRAALVGEHKGLLRRHRKPFRRRTVRDIFRGGLRTEPLAEITLVQSGPGCELRRGERAVLAQGLVKSQAFPDLNEWNAERAAEVVEN